LNPGRRCGVGNGSAAIGALMRYQHGCCLEA
jgi:hypothetical protein